MNSSAPLDINEKMLLLPMTGILDIDILEVENVYVENIGDDIIYTVTFNDHYRTVSEKVGGPKEIVKHAMEIYTVNGFGVMTGYERQQTIISKESKGLVTSTLKFNLIDVNKEKLMERYEI